MAAHSIDNLLHLVHSDGADELRLHVGLPPVIVLNGEAGTLDGPALTAQDAELLFHDLSTTRQRRKLRENGAVEFLYRFRNCATFVIRARLKDGSVQIDIH